VFLARFAHLRAVPGAQLLKLFLLLVGQVQP
jgi:hypothetical protein